MKHHEVTIIMKVLRPFFDPIGAHSPVDKIVNVAVDWPIFHGNKPAANNRSPGALETFPISDIQKREKPLAADDPSRRLAGQDHRRFNSLLTVESDLKHLPASTRRKSTAR